MTCRFCGDPAEHVAGRVPTLHVSSSLIDACETCAANFTFVSTVSGYGTAPMTTAVMALAKILVRQHSAR